MKQLISVTQIAIVGLLIFLIIPSARAGTSISNHLSDSKKLINIISGQVYDPQNRPVSDIYVELMNELYSTVSRYRTSSGGRFIFNNISSGSYKVKVLTTGTNYEEQMQEVQIINVFQGASDQVYVDFYLKYDRRKIAVGSGGAPEQIFVQASVTGEARKHYQKGVEQLADKKDKGLDEIEQALKISPDYYDALNRLGTEYVQRKEYQKAVPYLIKAIDINRRSFSSFYALAYAAYQMKQIPEAIEAARATTILNPNSITAQWLYGTVLRINGNYDKSEKALLQAKALSKKTPFAEIYWQLALLYNKLGRNKEAVAELESYIKIQPDSQNKKEIQELIVKLQNEAK